MHKRFFPLLVLFLGNLVPVAAQTPAPQIVPMQDRIARIVTVVPTVRVPLLAALFPAARQSRKTRCPFQLPVRRSLRRSSGPG